MSCLSGSDRLQDIEMQLSEIEMLLSMFPEQIIIDDEFLITELKDTIEKNESDPLNKIEFVFEHKTVINESNCKVDIFFVFPLNYPSKSFPEVTFRSSNLNRNQQPILNEQFQTFLTTQESGELCMFNIIEWIKESVESYLEPPTTATAQAKPEKTSGNLCRLWIYSHHIYSKIKRKNILEWSKELNLTGFSMPGKPGVVCVEGAEEHCEEFWQRNKRQTWKRLCVIQREVCKESKFVSKFKEPLKEMDFGVHGGRDYHMDLGKFAAYLTEHDCKQIFPLIFGVEGKSSSNSS